MSHKFNPIYCMIVLLVLLLAACAPAPQSATTRTTLAVESAPETEAPAVEVEEQPTETAVPPTPTSLPPTETAAPTPTIEPTPTLTPYQVWEATCLAEGADYVEVPFGTQDDGGTGIQTLSQVIDGSLFSQDLIPDCYMFGAEVTSPMIQERAVAWQIVPDEPETPGTLEIADLALPHGTHALLLKNVDGGQLEIQPTPEPWFKLVSPFQACNGDANPVMWGDGSFNTVFDWDCMGSGLDGEGWGHTDIMPPLSCHDQQGYGTFLAPASGILTSYECYNGFLGVNESCFELHFDNAEYLIGLREALAFTDMPNEEIESYIEQVTDPTSSFGGVSIQVGHVKLYPGLAGHHVEAGQEIGETLWNGVDAVRAAIHVYTTDESGIQYQLSFQNFPLAAAEEWIPYPQDGPLFNPSWGEPQYDPVSRNLPSWCKNE